MLLKELGSSLLFLSIYLIYDRGSRIHIESIKDGRLYLVKNNKHSNSSANILAKLNEKKNALCKFLSKQSKYNDNIAVQNLLNNSDVIIEEVAKKYEKEAAYSINKGEKIGICLRDKKTGDVENINDMFFVLIHELAHIMTNEYKHNKQFWDNMALLLENAIKAKLYVYTDYKRSPIKYCGHLISHSPYNK